jgi:AraC-like DNA-binding protein
MARRAADLRMRSQLIAPLLAYVREQGLDERAFIQRFALPADAAEQPEVVLPLATMHALFDHAAAELRDPCLGVHLAMRFPRGGYGVLEYSCRSAPTIREACGRIVRYIGLLNEIVTITLESRGGGGVIEQRIAGEPRCVGRHANEFFAAFVLRGARELSGAPCVPVRAWFAHAEPDDASGLVAQLGTSNLRWDAGSNGIELDAATLDTPLVSADPKLLSLLDQQAEQALGAVPEARLLALVRRRVRETIGETPPTLQGIAKQLHMSPRTLQRHLAAEGATFDSLLDELRRELALDYVRDRQRPLGEIAYLLGYSELSPFLRAFKRWTGKKPSELRGG